MNSNIPALNNRNEPEVRKERILIVEDEFLIAEYIRKALVKNGYEALEPAYNAEDALRKAGEESPDLILMDISLEGGSDGIEAAEKIQDRYGIPVIFLTAYSDGATIDRAKKAGPYGYLLKPFKEDSIPVIEIALFKHRHDQERRRMENLVRAQRDLAVKLSGINDLGETLRLCVETAMEISDMDSGGVYLIDEARGGLYLAFATGISERFHRAVGYFPSSSKNVNIVFQGAPVYFNYADFDRIRKGVFLDYLEEGLRFIAVIPVMDEGKVIASLDIASHIIEDVDPSIRASLETIAAQMGKAVIGARNLELLKESAHVHRTVLNNIDEMIFQLDPDGRVFFANNSALDHYGITIEEVNQSRIPFSFFWCGGSIDDVKAALTEVIARERPEYLESKCGDRYFELDIDPVLETGGITSIVCAARDVTERIQATESLRKALNASTNIIVRIIETGDPYTAGHQRNVAELARAIALSLNLPEEKVELVWSAALVHDIGKIDIPSSILSKPGKLSENEMSLIRDHPLVGYNILKSEYPSPLPEIVLQHHERVNGSGYPRGLRGKEILIEARIIAVADVVEAIAANRPYRPSMGIDRAIEEITINKNILYDPKVVDAAIRLFKMQKFSFIDSGER